MSKIEKYLLRALPVIAPLPTLYLVYLGLTGNGWHPIPAAVAGVALEVLAYFAITLIGAVSEHNRTLSAVEQSLIVSTHRAYFPGAAYVVIVLLLTVLTKMFPALYVYSLAVFPFIGLLSAWTQAEWRVLENHTEAKNKARADARQKAAEAKVEKLAALEKAKAEAEAAKLVEATKPEPQPVVTHKYTCEPCGYATNDQHGYAGHMRSKSHRLRVAPAEPTGYTLEIKPMENTK